MHSSFQKYAIVAAAVSITVLVLPEAASARWAGGGFHGGHIGGWRGGGIGGWRGGAVGWHGARWAGGWRGARWGWGAAGLGAGVALAAAASPYYGSYYNYDEYPYYSVSYNEPYYGYAYAPYAAAAVYPAVYAGSYGYGWRPTYYRAVRYRHWGW